MRVLFVCTGNICRSPTAERLAAAYAARLGIPDFATSSAGTHAVIGHPIHTAAATVLQELGGETAEFAARQLTTRIASQAELILTMTRAHRDLVLEIAPHKLRRTFTLGEGARLITEHGAADLADLAALRAHVKDVESLDVPDPIGADAEVFRLVGSQVAALLPPLLELVDRCTARTGE